MYSVILLKHEFCGRLCLDCKKLFFPGVLYLPILLFDFAKSENYTSDQDKIMKFHEAYVKFLHKNLIVFKKWN